MKFSDYINRFDARNLAGQFTEDKGGHPRMIDKNQRNVIVSHVTAAVRAATGREDEDDVGDVDLAPYLDVLPQIAQQAAERAGLSRPANRASSVRTFLRLVEGGARKTKHRVSPDSFLPDWKPLAGALYNHKTEGERFRRYLSWLEQFQHILLLNGHRTPSDVPDYITAVHFFEEAGFSAKKRGDLFGAYRKARELSERLDLPALEQPPLPAHRGVKSLPDLEALLIRGAARHTQVARAGNPSLPAILPLAPISAASTLDVIECLAPEFARAIRAYLVYSETSERKSADWRDTVVSAASAAVAELVRLGEDPFEMDPVDLFLQSREVPKLATRTSEAVKSLKRQAAVQATTEALPLIRLVTDAGARRAYAHSPIRVAAVHEAEDVAYYPNAVWNQLSALWAVTETIYGRELQMATATDGQWRQVVLTYEDLRNHMRRVNETREPSGQKDKSLVTITWGEAVCVGLRQLWLDCRALRTAWHIEYAAVEGVHGRALALRTPSVRNARARYLAKLRDYMLLALILDDGLRIKNYAEGRFRVNIVPLFEHASGEQRVTGLRTRFRGWDSEASTKKKRKAGGKENMRTRLVLQSIVDMELATDYVFEARLDDLVAAGLVTDRTSYDPDVDRFAFFVSPQSTRRSGAYSEAHLSRRFGRLLHWISRDLLGHTDPDGNPIPTWKELKRPGPEGKDLRRKWRSLWGAHIVRQLVAVYIGHILDQWTLACERTNDKRSTLEDFYVEFDSMVAEAMTKKGVKNPLHFKEVCLRLLGNEIIDWEKFDPEHPNTSAVPLAGPIVVPPPARKARRIRRAHGEGLPGQRAA